MKKSLLFCLTLFFCLIQARQSIYLVYFYSHQQEIAERYCEKKEVDCNGTCHLSKQLEQLSGNEKAPQPSFPKEQSFVYLKPSKLMVPPATEENSNQLFDDIVRSATGGFLQTSFVPPDSRV